MTPHGAFEEGDACWWSGRKCVVLYDASPPGYTGVLFRVRQESPRTERTVDARKLRPRHTPDDGNTSHVPDRVVGGTGERPAMRSVPKETVWRSKAYLEHARQTGREWGCPGCGTDKQIEASHHGSDGGMGLKASDCFAIGECHSCHRRTHGFHAGYPGLDSEETRAVIAERQVKTMAAWIQGRTG